MNIITDGSIITIANTKEYNNTLNNQVNWTWRQFNNFILNINKDNLIAFEVAWEDEWTFEFLINEETNKSYFRKFEQSIKVTNNNLHLINWTDLTNSLQFKNTKLPNELNKDLKLELKNGFYRVVIKELFDKENFDYDPTNKTNYILELFYETQNPNIKIDKVIWVDNFTNDDTIFLSEERNEFDDLIDKMINDSKKKK